MKKAGPAAIVVAVIMSVIIVPFLLLFEFAGGTTLAFSGVLKENREEELFAEFEKEGGIRFLYHEVERLLAETEQNLALPEDSNLLEGVISYEDVSSVSYGVYSALLRLGETYEFDLSVQKERIKKNAEAYCDSYIEAQELPEGADKEYLKQTYLSEIYAKIDAETADMEEELNSNFALLYDTEELKEIEQWKNVFGIERFSQSWLLETVRLALKAEIAVIAVLVLLLLICHLFRPSGFFVAGAVQAVSGALLVLFSVFLNALSMPDVISENTELNSAVYAVGEKLVSWITEGYLQFGTFSMCSGVVFVIIGVVFFFLRRKMAAKVEM